MKLRLATACAFWKDVRCDYDYLFVFLHAAVETQRGPCYSHAMSTLQRVYARNQPHDDSSRRLLLGGTTENSTSTRVVRARLGTAPYRAGLVTLGAVHRSEVTRGDATLEGLLGRRVRNNVQVSRSRWWSRWEMKQVRFSSQLTHQTLVETYR